MIFQIKPGNALLCRINAHRSRWNGQICEEASAWNCGAPQDFRDEYCEAGNPRCFHIYVFAAHEPHLIIDDKGAGWIFSRDPHAFDRQILLLSGQDFREPRGIRSSGGAQCIYGAYRVRKVVQQQSTYRTLWVVVPYEDGWTCFEHLRVEAPYYRKLEGPYIQEVERTAVLKVFRQARERAEESGREWPSADAQARFQTFAEHISEWLDEAAEHVSTPRHVVPAVATSTRKSTAGGAFAKMGDVLPDIAVPDRPGSPQAAKPPTSATKDPVTAAVAQLLEGKTAERVRAMYGEGTLQRLRVGLLTKPIVLFAGRPGMGKSRLAVELVQDPTRVLVVPVASTWRGREDLFGYVNPISHEFEPTPFTTFLYDAAKAEARGDHRVRVVVFEEFNLSPPEHWFSEILVRSQYSPDQRENRTIFLGGKRVRGWSDETTKVYLSPFVRFIGTINIDHTARSLSPRVLDRAAVVEFSLDPEKALQEVGVQLDPRSLEAVRELTFRLRHTPATFSIRTALSLRQCLDHRGELGLQAGAAVDLVLAQEVLSKLSLSAADPSDRSLCEQLLAWTEEYSKELPVCAARITSWWEMLEQGRDVVQA
ncbi:MAG: hypothetical protein D6815_09690 [Candidatus Dadabacteria bacterium]|nr:MAG: hypothetical protein D6815_09690 [Candidatus Dadabacteria bacterium]